MSRSIRQETGNCCPSPRISWSQPRGHGRTCCRSQVSFSFSDDQDARALDNLKKLDMRTDQDREPASGTLPLLAAAPWHISASLDFHLCRHFLSLSLLLQVILWNNLIASALWDDHFSDALGWHKEGLENMALKYVNKASLPQPKLSKPKCRPVTPTR